MKSIRGQAILDKDEALKGLWESIEALLKGVKSLLGRSGAGHTRQVQTKQIQACLNSIERIEKYTITPGYMFKMTKEGDEEWMVARFEGFIESTVKDAPIIPILSVIASTIKFQWDTVEDFYTPSYDTDVEKGVEFKLEDLPTLVGSPFMGKLFDELLK